MSLDPQIFAVGGKRILLLHSSSQCFECLITNLPETQRRDKANRETRK